MACRLPEVKREGKREGKKSGNHAGLLGVAFDWRNKLLLTMKFRLFQ